MLAVGNVGSSGAGRWGAQAVTPGGEAQLWDGDGEVAGGSKERPLWKYQPEAMTPGQCLFWESVACGMVGLMPLPPAENTLCWALMVYPRWLQPHFSLQDLIT